MFDRLTRILNDKGLRGSVFRGGAILALGGALEQATRMIRNVVLARLLAPESFGLMAIVIGVIGLLDSLTEVGVRQAIIQNPRGSDREYLNVAWWFSFLRGLALYSVAFLLAPIAASFYENPELTLLIRVSCLGVFFNSCFNVALVSNLKSMEFKYWTFVCNGGGILAIIATILIAFYLPSVWVLVFGTVSEAAIRCILSYIFCPFAPQFKISKTELKSLFQFTSGMAGLPILYAASRSADIFVLGKVVPSILVGIYSLSSSLARSPLDFVKSVIAQVAMPSFSAIQKDKVRLQSAVYMGVSLLGSGIFPIIGFFWIYGGSLLHALYGREYSAAGVPAAILFMAGAIEITAIPIATVYFAVGKPQLHRMFSLVRTVALLITIAPACILYGWIGAASSVLFASLSGYMFQFYRLRLLIGIKISVIAKSLLIPCLISFFPLPVWLIGEMYPDMMHRLAFAAVGLIIVCAAVLYFNLVLNRETSSGMHC